MSSIPPQVHLVVYYTPPNTKLHLVLENISLKRIIFECIYLEDCLYNCLDSSGKSAFCLETSISSLL